MPDPLVARLREVGCVFAEEEAAEIRRVLGDDEATAIAVVAARRDGVPLEHVLGVARFAGVEVAVGPGVFVPRVRAEALVDEATRVRPDARVIVDLGCGSGAIAAALANRLPGAEIHATDLDPAALAYARANGERHGFAVHRGDWWDGLPRDLRGRVDLAVAYLPHVPTARLDGIAGDYRAHEPLASVAGGADGLDPLRAVLKGAQDWLADDGVMITLVAGEQLDVARDLCGGCKVLLVEG